MYFLSHEEQRYLLRRLLPQARENEVHPELRGWNWHQPPLLPVYEPWLALHEIASQYCPTGRDVFVRRVLGQRPAPNAAMIAGRVLHQTVADLVLAAKRAIYNAGPGRCLPALLALPGPNDPGDGQDGPTDVDRLAAPDQIALRAQVQALWAFEQRRIVARVEDVLSRQPHIGADSLAALALPVTVESRLDGRFLGLSQHLSADAFNFAEPMMVDLKFGPPQPFHRLSTTGYALVMESLYEVPVNVGCVVYVRFRDGQVLIERDFHHLSDELRQEFIEARDERAQMVQEEIDPGTPAECPASCHCWSYCHGE